MAKLFQVVLTTLVVSITICSALPASINKFESAKSKFLARQESAQDIPSQTPYPAAGIRPAVPFNLPTEEKLIAPVNHYLPPLLEPAKFLSPPAEVYGPPALTYGPPDVTTTNESEEIIETETVKPQEVPQEEPTEQPEDVQVQSEQPDTVESINVSEEQLQKNNDVENQAEANKDTQLPEKIVLIKGRGKKAAKLRLAKLELIPAAFSGRQAIAPQPIFLIDTNNGQITRF